MNLRVRSRAFAAMPGECVKPELAYRRIRPVQTRVVFWNLSLCALLMLAIGCARLAKAKSRVRLLLSLSRRMEPALRPQAVRCQHPAITKGLRLPAASR